MLYLHIPPLGENITIYIEPLPVDDLVHMEKDIEWEVRRLRFNHSGDPSMIISQYLR